MIELLIDIFGCGHPAWQRADDEAKTCLLYPSRDQTAIQRWHHDWLGMTSTSMPLFMHVPQARKAA
jgi:hypothetical protein